MLDVGMSNGTYRLYCTLGVQSDQSKIFGTFLFGHPPSKFSENSSLGVVFCVEHESDISFLKFSFLGKNRLQNGTFLFAPQARKFQKFFKFKNIFFWLISCLLLCRRIHCCYCLPIASRKHFTVTTYQRADLFLKELPPISYICRRSYTDRNAADLIHANGNVLYISIFKV